MEEGIFIKIGREFVKWALIFLLFVAVLALFGAAARFLIYALGSKAGLSASMDTDTTQQAFLVVVVIGFFTMALLQSLRSILPLRGWFHQRTLKRYLFATELAIDDVIEQEGSEAIREARKKAKKQPSERADENLKSLLNLANAGDAVTFLNLPIEQVAGQIGAVAELLMTNLATQSTDKQSQQLLTSLSGPKGAKDALIYFGVPMVSSTKEDDASLRERVAYHVQRNIDQLQIQGKTAWQRWLRLVAIAASSGIALSLFMIGRPSLDALSWRVLWQDSGKALMIGLLSGYIAGVFRDCVAIIERLRH
ncbi:MAG TPA: hypothetical protein VHQ22_22280 [Terriglobales bacterium]|jgi:hypothetical protein|nr:hypothetical protein [Terriglobales bacterium]